MVKTVPFGEGGGDGDGVAAELLAGQVVQEVRGADGADEEGQPGALRRRSGPVGDPLEEEGRPGHPPTAPPTMPTITKPTDASPVRLAAGR